jgi:hypothetical protein
VDLNAAGFNQTGKETKLASNSSDIRMPHWTTRRHTSAFGGVFKLEVRRPKRPTGAAKGVVPVRSTADDIKEERPKHKSFWGRVPGWLYALAGFVGLLISLLSVYPWLSIAEGDRLDPANPYSQMFVAKNEGYLPIFSPDITCDEHIKMTADGKSDFLNLNGINIHASYPSSIVHGGTFTASCYTLKFDISPGPGPIAFNVPGSMLDIKITYAFWRTNRPFWRRSQKFHFETRSWDGKTQQWAQEGESAN